VNAMREPRIAEPRRRLGQQPTHPARCGAIEARVVGLREHDEDRQRVVEANPGQLSRRSLDHPQGCRS